MSVIVYRFVSLEAASALLNNVSYESLTHLIKSYHICGHDGLLCTCVSIFLFVGLSLSVSQQPVKRLTLEERVKCALEMECDWISQFLYLNAGMSGVTQVLMKIKKLV